MGYNLVMRCETCDAQTGVLRGYEAQAIAVFARDHPRRDGCVKTLFVDNGWSEDEESCVEEKVFPPDYPPHDQPERYRKRGY